MGGFWAWCERGRPGTPARRWPLRGRPGREGHRGPSIKDSPSSLNRQNGSPSLCSSCFLFIPPLLHPICHIHNRFSDVLFLRHLTVLAWLSFPLRFRAVPPPSSLHLVSSLLDDLSCFATGHSVATAVFVTNFGQESTH